MARRDGLPVLPGFVVESTACAPFMELGAEAMRSRGSGGARLAILGAEIPFGDELAARAHGLGATRMVVRSSTVLEESGAWAGAFTSYLDIELADLPKTVRGCWASAFSVETLRRLETFGIAPATVSMAVLIQPNINATAGGVAEITADGTVKVSGVPGSPEPMLQGWIGSVEAVRGPGQVGEAWSGPLLDIVDAATLDGLAGWLDRAGGDSGMNRCEWAIEDQLWILQLDKTRPLGPAAVPEPVEQIDPILVAIARLAARAPGALGEALVIPWAVSGLPQRGVPMQVNPRTAFERAVELSRELTAEAWGLPVDEAMRMAKLCISGLRGIDPTTSIDTVRRLRPVDPSRASEMIGYMDALCIGLVQLGAAATRESAWHLSPKEIPEIMNGLRRPPEDRIGVGQWEPMIASTVLACGTRYLGTPAAPGIGAGVEVRIDDVDQFGAFPQRGLITSHTPAPGLSSLLWDAAGIVTVTGSPAAHLFESARALGIPGVCGVNLPSAQDRIVAVNGDSGLVATLPLFEEDEARGNVG